MRHFSADVIPVVGIPNVIRPEVVMMYWPMVLRPGW